VQGARGNDVEALQLILQANGYYKGKVSGILNADTVKAVKTLQKSAKIATPKTAGYGAVGPKTRSFLNSLVKEAKADLKDEQKAAKAAATPAIPAKPATPAVPGVSPAKPATPATPASAVQKVLSATPDEKITTLPSFSRSLVQGSKGKDVEALQLILKANGYYAKEVTGTMNKDTVAAVKKLQEAAKIATPKTAGYGNVGPSTRTFLNSLVKEAKATVTEELTPEEEVAPPKQSAQVPEKKAAVQKEAEKSSAGTGGGTALDLLKKIQKN
jgi:peptidoglycan hydrolase-like protein with peptidoglycan-binding domain